MRTRLVVGIACCLIGAVWFGQGVGWIGGSFMSGHAVWAVIGVLAIAFGGFVIRGPRRIHDDG